MDEEKYLDLDGLIFFWDGIKNKFVEKSGSKKLSDNNYSDDERTKVVSLKPIVNSEIDQLFE